MNTIKKILVVNLILYSGLCAQVSQDFEDTIHVDTIIDDYGESSLKVNNQEPEEKQGPYPVNTIFLGPGFGYLYYDEIFVKEDIIKLLELGGLYIDSLAFDGEPKSTEYGICPGISFSYQYIGDDLPISVSIPNLSLVFGISNTYDGATQDSLLIDTTGPVKFAVNMISPYEFTKTNIFLSYGFSLGYLFVINKVQLHVFLGFDLRMWIRNLENKSETPSGLRIKNYERYNWIYVPVNAVFDYSVSDKFTVGAQITANLMTRGTMQIVYRIRDNFGGSAELDADKVKLGKRMGYYGAIIFNMRLSPRIGMKLTPYFEYYQFGKSNVGTMQWKGAIVSNRGHFYEPASKTFWGGLSFKLMFYPKTKRKNPTFKKNNRPR